MTRKEERTQSFEWCISDYLGKLSHKVQYGQIDANHIALVLRKIMQLNELVLRFVGDQLDEKATEDMFIPIQLELNELVKWA